MTSELTEAFEIDTEVALADLDDLLKFIARYLYTKKQVYAILATVVASLPSLIGIFAIFLKEAVLDRILFVLVSLSAGPILGAAFLDLLPEAVEFLGEEQCPIAVVYITLGFLSFFFLERFVYWYHGHVHGYESKVEEKMTIKKCLSFSFFE